MTSIERTAYPRFKRLITARELHVFFSPSQAEAEWAAERTQSEDHQLSLLVMLKSYQRMGCFPKLADVPEIVAEFVRRVVELPERTVPVHASPRTGEQHRALIRQRVGLTYDQAQARKVADEVIRTEAAAKNDPADLINTALEKLVETGLELPAFSTLDAMASALRAEVNKVICGGIYERLSEAHRERLLKLLTERGLDGKTLFNRFKQSAERASWSHSRTWPSTWPGSMAWATARCGCRRWRRARSPTSPGRQPRPMPECWAITR
ncbi:DUF4158 domain-containing protein [Nonomuraea sp. NPDC046802]|uniref:DUF4158 domain-containing protein n=1 Tax=Nonomuraea sp. NPDC046802 TaxID=3154919 RepID=UPI0033BFE88A